MSFNLGRGSRAELVGVHPDLVRVVERAIQITRQDFTVHDGLRSVEEQREYVQRGVSKTMKSKHLEGLAVDLVPVINGQARWEWPPIYQIAAAMHAAAAELGVALRWGGVWDRNLNDLPGDSAGLQQAVRDYTARHPGPDFIDGPHYEIVSGSVVAAQPIAHPDPAEQPSGGLGALLARLVAWLHKLIGELK